MESAEQIDELTKKLIATYKLQVSKDVIASAFTNQPKIPILLSRASFRPNVDARTKERRQFQQERRNLLRLLGLAIVSAPFLLWLRAAYSAPQTQTPAKVPATINAQPSTGAANPPAASQPPASQNLLVNAARVPVDRSLSMDDPAYGPIILIHLDNGQYVAYSSICTHAGCEVQFDPSLKDIVCPCHGAVYDPYNNARVLGGPAPYPLQKIPIKVDQSTGNVYVTG